MRFVKRFQWLIGFVLFLGGLTVVYGWLASQPDPNREAYFICDYPPLRRVKAGMSKGEVAAILGAPLKERLKYQLKDYREGLSRPKARMVERCIYETKGWHGTIEIYFNSQGMMVGRNCGFG